MTNKPERRRRSGSAAVISNLTDTLGVTSLVNMQKSGKRDLEHNLDEDPLSDQCVQVELKSD